MAESTAITTNPQQAQQGALAISGDDQLQFIADAVRTFQGVQQLANVISSMESSPSHLRGKPADCFRVTVQAVKWRMDPFAVAECTSLVHGRLCYEGKLVAAVLRSMGAIVGRLEHEITGKGQDAAITITGMPKGGKKPCSVSGTVREWRTIGKDKNGNRIDNAWDKQPETMLVYRGTRQWARLFTPEAILGVYTPDELEDVREVEATVVHTDPPAARTAAPAATENGGPAKPGTEQPSGGAQAGSSAPAGGQSPAAGKEPHPAIAAARALYKTLNAHDKGLGKRLVDRLCKLAGGTEPLNVPEKNLDQFGKDVATLAQDPTTADATLAEWEREAAAPPSDAQEAAK
jgi:hypothetical protein